MTTLDKIKEEFIARYPKNYANEPELGGRSCVFSLNEVLQIIDKYAEQSGWEEMTVSCKHCGKDMTFKIATIGEPCEYCKYKSIAEQEPNRDIKEIAEIMKCDADAETKCKMVSNILTAKPHYFVEQEPCDDAQERYEDLCEYFGDAKDILKSRKDFKAWLERIKWHIHKAEELYEKYEHKQKPCDDVVSRQYLIDIATKDGAYDYVSAHEIINAPSVKPQEPKTGHWIITRTIMHDGEFYCDKCNCDSPHNEKWDYCPNCGARMVEQQEEKDKE